MNFEKIFLLLLTAWSVSLYAENITLTPKAVPGVVKADNHQASDGFNSTTVQAQLRVNVKDSENAVRFVRTNTDPVVLTKLYRLKHAEPYALRGYLLSVVQGTQISGNPVQVDAVKFVNGQGVLLVSAEDYRFQQNGSGNSIDEIIERLDKPGIGFSSGRPKFIYFPKVNSAANLREMLINSGASAKDNEFANGIDVLTVDGNLNALFIAAPAWSYKHILEQLEKYDRVMPEIRISYKLLEVSSENDDKLGVDFQSWKNNDGVDFFSTGGRYRNNWAGTFAGGINGSHFSKTEFFNFNPKWNSRYLDFLSSSGRAKVVTQGVITAKNRRTSAITVATGLFYEEQTLIPPASLNSKIPDGKEKLPESADWQLPHGNAQNTAGSDSFRFEFSVAPVITAKASTLPVKVSGTSLQGWNSDGSPRLNVSSFSTEIQIGNNGKEFVIGGIRRSNLIRSTAGIPLLKDIPILGWLFSTETETLRNSELILIAQVETALPFDQLPEKYRQDSDAVREKLTASKKSPRSNLGFEQFGLDSNKIE